MNNELINLLLNDKISLYDALLKSLLLNPNLKEILDGCSLDEFVEERVSEYYMEVENSVANGCDMNEAKEHALKSILAVFKH